MNNKLQKSQKEAVVTYFETIFRNLCIGLEKNQEIYVRIECLGPRFENGTSWSGSTTPTLSAKVCVLHSCYITNIREFIFLAAVDNFHGAVYE